MPDHDGSRDFDFAFGEWDLRLRRLQRPLSGSTTWSEFSGRTSCRPIWDGRGQVEEFRATDPADGRSLEAVTLRLYHPDSHEWSLYWVNRRNPVISTPQKGKFVDGRGEFLDRDTINGKAVMVRYLWTQTTTESPHFEQAFSTDEGRTWETNWVTDQTRRRA